MEKTVGRHETKSKDAENDKIESSSGEQEKIKQVK